MLPAHPDERIERSIRIASGDGLWWRLLDRVRDGLNAVAPRATVVVDSLMAQHPLTLDAEMTLDSALACGFGRQLFTAFPVIDSSGRAVGLVAFSDVRSVDPEDRATTTVAQVMCTDPAVLVRSGATIAELLSCKSFARRGRAVVIDHVGLPLGLLSITDVRGRLGLSLPDPAAALNV